MGALDDEEISKGEIPEGADGESQGVFAGVRSFVNRKPVLMAVLSTAVLTFTAIRFTTKEQFKKINAMYEATIDKHRELLADERNLRDRCSTELDKMAADRNRSILELLNNIEDCEEERDKAVRERDEAVGVCAQASLECGDVGGTSVFPPQNMVADATECAIGIANVTIEFQLILIRVLEGCGDCEQWNGLLSRALRFEKDVVGFCQEEALSAPFYSRFTDEFYWVYTDAAKNRTIRAMEDICRYY